MEQDNKYRLINLTNKAYYGRKNGDSFYYNYDISPLIKMFSFTEFLSTNVKTDHGAILVITNKQYILGYTAEFGIGTHKAAMARIMKEIIGGGQIENINEAKRLESFCDKNFITARITYDYRDIYGLPSYKGAIYFKFPEKDTITIEQYEIFKQFYEDYHAEIEMLIRKYKIEKFNIQYGYIDESGTKEIRTVSNLKEVLEYLETRIDTLKLIPDIKETILSNPGIKKKVRIIDNN